jgi:hypothetical protein
MKINKSFIRIALAVGLIGLAACGGSDSSSRNRNSSTVTNVKRYEGVISLQQMSGSDDEVPTGDQYTVGFDIDLDSVSSHTFQTTYWKGDFRKSITNLSIEAFDSNIGSTDLSKIDWAKCPIEAAFASGTGTKLDLIMIMFAEAPNDTVKNAECGTPSDARYTSHGVRGFYDSDGKYVPTTSNRRFTIRYDFENGVVVPEDSATLGSILPNGLDDGFSYSGVSVNNKANNGYSATTSKLKFSSTKLKDYQPYDFTASSQAATIDLNWKRSADLETTDALTYEILWSTDNFETNQNIPVEDTTEYVLPACLVNPKNELSADSKVSLQLVAVDNAGIRSPAVEQSASVSADTVKCPTNSPLASPTDFKVVAEKEDVKASWTGIANKDEKSLLTYCLSELNPNPADSTSNDLISQQESVIIACSTETSMLISEVKYPKAKETSYFVQVHSAAGSVSARSDIQTIATPRAVSVDGLKVVTADDGLTVKWNPSGYKKFDQVIITFAINSNDACSDNVFKIIEDQSINLGSFVGAVVNTENYFISNDRLGEAYVPGAVVTICAMRYAWSTPSDWSSTTYTNSSAAVVNEVTTTLAPAVEETAKTAIVTTTATEVQLPAAAVEVAIKVEDVYTGFNVSASDVKSIEYQIDAGSWTAVTPGAALKIPNAASKMAVRVTKTNGETVVSEKAIVRTEETTETTVAASDSTMAPADTTAPETTEAPASSESSESSSGNNILLYILGFVILAAIAGFLFKKKSASTK